MSRAERTRVKSSTMLGELLATYLQQQAFQFLRSIGFLGAVYEIVVTRGASLRVCLSNNQAHADSFQVRIGGMSSAVFITGISNELCALFNQISANISPDPDELAQACAPALAEAGANCRAMSNPPLICAPVPGSERYDPNYSGYFCRSSSEFPGNEAGVECAATVSCECTDGAQQISSTGLELVSQ